MGSFHQRIWLRLDASGTESGEMWEYNNFKKFLIPFYFNFKAHVEIFNFDTHGILTSFNVDR